MHPIDQLERRIEDLLLRKMELEEENKKLAAELEEARLGRQDILGRVERLLARIDSESPPE